MEIICIRKGEVASHLWLRQMILFFAPLSLHFQGCRRYISVIIGIMYVSMYVCMWVCIYANVSNIVRFSNYDITFSVIDIL